MKKLYFVLCSSCLILLSCAGKKNGQSPADAINTADSIKNETEKTTFFPVTSFLKGQLISLDSIPVTILQIRMVNSKPDSSWISREKIRPLLQPFITDLIDKENLTSYFKESKFNDQSTDAITFTYNPKIALPDSIDLLHWDLYVDPEKGTVKRVYIVKQLKENGIAYTQQLTWQTDKWAKIVTIDNKAGTILSDVKWVWDLTEEPLYNQADKN